MTGFTSDHYLSRETTVSVNGLFIIIVFFSHIQSYIALPPAVHGVTSGLGQLMVDCVSEATGAKNRGTVPRSDLTGLNFSEIPSVFIEMGFMTNPEEDALLSSGEYQDKIVAGMANSLMDWYGAER